MTNDILKSSRVDICLNRYAASSNYHQKQPTRKHRTSKFSTDQNRNQIQEYEDIYWWLPSVCCTIKEQVNKSVRHLSWDHKTDISPDSSSLSTRFYKYANIVKAFQVNNDEICMSSNDGDSFFTIIPIVSVPTSRFMVHTLTSWLLLCFCCHSSSWLFEESAFGGSTNRRFKSHWRIDQANYPCLCVW